MKKKLLIFAALVVVAALAASIAWIVKPESTGAAGDDFADDLIPVDEVMKLAGYEAKGGNAYGKTGSGVPDITVTSGPYMIEVAGKVAGVDPAEDDDPAFAKIKELSENGAIFYSGSADLIAKFEQGEVSVAVCQDFNASTIRGAVEGLEYVIVPDEGTFLGINSVNIVKGSKNVDLAYKFISWLISYDVQYKDALDKVEAPANTKVVLTPEQAEGICYGETVALSGAPNWALYSERNAAWIERYNEEIYQ